MKRPKINRGIFLLALVFVLPGRLAYSDQNSQNYQEEDETLAMPQGSYETDRGDRRPAIVGSAIYEDGEESAEMEQDDLSLKVR